MKLRHDPELDSPPKWMISVTFVLATLVPLGALGLLGWLIVEVIQWLARH